KDAPIRVPGVRIAGLALTQSGTTIVTVEADTAGSPVLVRWDAAGSEQWRVPLLDVVPGGGPPGPPAAPAAGVGQVVPPGALLPVAISPDDSIVATLDGSTIVLSQMSDG